MDIVILRGLSNYKEFQNKQAFLFTFKQPEIFNLVVNCAVGGSYTEAAKELKPKFQKKI